MKFPSLKCILLYKLISFQVMTKTNFTKSYKIARVAPSFSSLLCSLGLAAKPLVGIQGAKPRKLLGFSHIKDENQHSELPPPLCFVLFFLRIFFSSSQFFSAVHVFFFLGAALPWISKPCTCELKEQEVRKPLNFFFSDRVSKHFTYCPLEWKMIQL